jgi:hypothetical protein
VTYVVGSYPCANHGMLSVVGFVVEIKFGGECPAARPFRTEHVTGYEVEMVMF